MPTCRRGPVATRCRCFFFNDAATTEIYTLSLHDALPISLTVVVCNPEVVLSSGITLRSGFARSEEHTSELQSPCNLACRLLLGKQNRGVSTGPAWSRAAPRAQSAAATLEP